MDVPGFPGYILLGPEDDCVVALMQFLRHGLDLDIRINTVELDGFPVAPPPNADWKT